MTSKGIKKALTAKINDWIDHVEDENIKKVIRDNAIVTGGAIVSLLCNETPHDYDVYFKTFESCLAVAKYYANQWNKMHPDKSQVKIEVDDATGRIKCFIQSTGVASEGENETDPEVSEPDNDSAQDKPKYRPKYFSTNAISLSDKIQLVIRFYGSVDDIHKNYDFVHCTCSFDVKTSVVNLPARALEAILNKELYYCGSKYPLCSIIRSRKFIQRGWSINAGQYLKMCLQLNDLDLKDLDVFADQLAGVDSAYFSQAIDMIRKRKEDDPGFTVDNTYLFEIINRIF